VLGDICEAVIGAIYLDGGYAAASQFVERNWLERMRKPRRPLRDPKTVLQEWAQSKGLPTPVYREIERTGRITTRSSASPSICRGWRPPKASAAPSAPPRRSQPP
jgi:dsRNA-specific ribonuclease